jgi:hypothetical protein
MRSQARAGGDGAQTAGRAAARAVPARNAPEREADAMAEHALGPASMGRSSGIPGPTGLASNQAAISTSAGRAATAPAPEGESQIEDDEEEDLLQTASESAGASTPSARRTPGAEAAVRAVSGPGRLLPEPLRAYFEPRYGTSLAAVRLHTGSEAGSAARAINAEAYTYGTDIAFAPGRYQPASRTGLHLIGHELAHVAQDRGGGGLGLARRTAGPAAASEAAGLAAPDSASERDADRMTDNALSGGSARPAVRADGEEVHRFSGPQHVPEKTYIAGQDPLNDNFLSSAIEYHTAWGLNPQNIDSLEDVIDDLKGDTGALQRIRIVTHASQTNLFTALFEGGPAGIQESELRGFATSEAEGLKSLLFTGPSAGGFFPGSVYSDVLTDARQDNPAALQPFALDTAGSAPSGVLEEFIRRVVDLTAYATGSDAQTQSITAALRTVIAALRTRVRQTALPGGGNSTAAQVTGLESAIAAASGTTFTLPVQNARFMQNLGAAETALSGTFLADLNAVRQRFSASSWIDIRGCRVGQSESYLQAISEFFGRSGNKPHVSGPDWFQSFPTIGVQTVDPAQIRTFSSNRWVRQALDHWFDETGIVARLEWARHIYLRLIIRIGRTELEAADLSGAPSLIGGLSPPDDPSLMLPPLGLGGEMPQLSPRTSPLLGGRPPGQSSLGLQVPSLGSTLLPGLEAEEERLRQEIERLNRLNPEQKLRYYLDQDLLLPYNHNGSGVDIRLLVRNDRRQQALDNWLNSQWAEAAPGLAQLQAMNISDVDPRRVAALQRDRSTRTRTTYFISPDSRYREHIKEI